MNRLLDKRNALLLGLIMIVSGLAVRSVTFDLNNSLCLGVSFFILSVGIGFLLSVLFSKDTILFKDLSKYTAIPVCVVAAFLILNKLNIDIPLLKGSILFVINLAFFIPEIKKAINNLETDK